MSRFNDSECDDYDQEAILAHGRWRGRVASRIRGKNGQALLRELLAALEELPSKRLMQGELAKDGDVCALGALALRRRVLAGETRETVLASLEAIVTDIDSDEFTVEMEEWAMRALDLPREFAVEVPRANDDDVGSLTPEERYEYMLKWVRARLKPEAS